MSTNRDWKDLLTYNKDERRGILVLIFIILSLIIYNVYGPFESKKEVDFTEFELTVAKLKKAAKEEKLAKKKSYKSYTKKKKLEFKLHYFNPNTITKADWLKMGLKEYQAKSITKYIRKGGSFKSAEDLRKMYCLNDKECDLLIPYVKLPKKVVAKKETKKPYKKFIPKVYYFELNTVIFDSLLQIRGIGPSTAKAIINYRKRLGGYYSVQQLMEVYLINVEKFTSISNNFYVNTDSLKPYIDLNSGNYYSYKKHPYVSNIMAYNINAYREMHGDYKHISDLKNVEGINDSIYKRIYRYFAPLK